MSGSTSRSPTLSAYDGEPAGCTGKLWSSAPVAGFISKTVSESTRNIVFRAA